MKHKIDHNDETLCLMTLEEFSEAVRSGGFIDYDGFGCYATEEYFYYDCQFDFGDPENHPDWATHVNWFNR